MIRNIKKTASCKSHAGLFYILGLLLFWVGGLCGFCLFVHKAHGADQAKALLLCGLVLLVLSALILLLRKRRAPRLLLTLGAIFLELSLLLSLLSSGVYSAAQRWEQKNLPGLSVTRSELFSNQTVLAVLPHPDDEINLLGGLLEEYTATGSDVYLCYISNPDPNRESELYALMARWGIPTSQVSFLRFSEGENDIEQITAALQPVIDELRPTVIFGITGDSHLVHQQTEQALAAANTYEATVYWGSAYNTWLDEAPFTPGTVRSCASLSQNDIRFPVTADSVSPLSPDLSSIAEDFACYPSQDAALRSYRVMRSDRAFVSSDTIDLYKLTDQEGNFVNKVLMTEDTYVFHRSLQGDATPEANFQIQGSGTLECTGEDLVLTLPKGKACQLLAYDANGNLLDAISLYHPTGLGQWLLRHIDVWISLRPQAQLNYYRSIYHMIKNAEA